MLVSGATGGVGAIAVQYAAAAGARVIATAQPGAEADFARALGAAEVVDYTGDVAAQVRLASTRGYGPDQHPAAATLDRLGSDLATGRLTVPVARTYPLDQVPAAFADFTAGTLGKLAVTVA